MIPVLFKEDEQVFSHNGIGALYESLSCDVLEEENGAFTMELEYPVDGELFSEIKDFRIIQAKPNDIDEPHNFRIYEIEKSIDELTVYVRANTRTNDLGNNLITNYVGTNVTPQQAMNGIKSNLMEPTNFDLISDIQTRSNVDWTRINPLNAIVGVRGSLVDIWGGEIKRTNTAIHLYSRRGKDNVVTIRPGKNIEGLNMTVSTAGLVTKILPTFSYSPVEVPKYQMITKSDGTKEKRRVTASGATTLRDDITVLGDVVSSPNVDNYPNNYWISVDYDDDDDLRDTVDTFINTKLKHAEESSGIVDMSGFNQELENFVKTELDKKAKQYFTHRNPGVDIPTVRIKVDMLQLSDSPDWEEFKNLERIGLTDTLDVWVEEYDIDVEVRVTSLTYDSIAEHVIGFNAGSDRAPRQSAVEKKYDDLTKATDDYITSFKNGVQNVMRNTADGLNRKFEGYTEPPAELSSEGDIWFKEIGEGKVEIWIHDGVYWQPLMTEDFVEQMVMDLAVTQAEFDKAKLQAVADSEQALADAIAHAEAEDARIRGELESDIGGAIDIAEQAKADAVSKANQALIDAKAHAEAEDARITKEIGLEVDGAIALAEQAKADATAKANQALKDAKAHADAEILLVETRFDDILEGVESDVADAKQTADDAIFKIDNDIADKFTSLDAELVDIEAISNSAQENAQTALDQSQEALGDASTALTNAQTALTRADTAIGSASGAVTKANEAKDAATVLGGKVSGFETTVAGFNQTVNNYTGQVSGFRNDISGLESTVADYATEVDEFGDTVSTYATQVSTLNNTVSGFNSTVATYGTAVTGYKNQVSTFNNTVSGFNSTVANYTTEVNELGEEVESYATEVATLTNTVSGFQSTVSKVEQDYEDVSGTVADHTTSISNMNGQIALKANTTTVSALTGRVTTAETGISANSKAIKLKAATTTVNTLTGRVNTAETGITANANAIKLKASTTDVSELTGRVSTAETGITANANAIKLKAATTTVNTLTGRVSTAETNITANANAIKLKAATTTVNTLTGRVSTAESSITANATAITQRLTTTQVNTLVDGKGFAKETSVSTRFNDIQSTVDGTTQTIATLRTDVNGKATIAQYNTLKSTVDGTVTRVGNAEGKITTIETSVSGIQTTVASKADKTQITQLNNAIVLKADKTALSSKKDEYTKTITITGNGNTYYPLYFINGDQSKPRVIRITRKFNDPAPGNIWNPGQPTHPGGLNLEWVGNFGGWGGAAYKAALTSFGETYTTMLADLGIEHSAQSYAFYLRGGGAKYTISSDQPLNIKVGYSTSDTIWGTNKSAAPKTSVNRKRIDGLVTAQNSQITVLNDAINLRVTKNDVVNQINVSTEGILIDGKKVHITGTTTIDNGVIKNAHIGNLDASKINAGTINAARLDSKAIVTAGLTANVIKSTHIETSTATVDKLFATDVMINRLTAKTAFITSVKAVDIDAARITTGTIKAARLDAKAIVTAGLTADVVKSTHLETSTATITKLFATDAAVGTLTAKTAFINSIKAVDIDAARITSGVINAARLNASAIVTAGLTANVIKSTHISGDTALFDKLFSTSSATDRLSARTAWIKNANIGDATINGAKIINATIASAKIASLDVAKLSGNTSNFVSTAWNGMNSSVSITSTGLRSAQGVNSILVSNGRIDLKSDAPGDLTKVRVDGIGIRFETAGKAARIRYNGTNIVMDNGSLGMNNNHINSVDWIRLIGTGDYETTIHKNPSNEGGALVDSKMLTIGLGTRNSFSSIASFFGQINIFKNIFMLNNNIADLNRLSLKNSTTHLMSLSTGGLLVDGARITIAMGNTSSIDTIARFDGQINFFKNVYLNGKTIFEGSDERIKENITDRTEDDLATIMAIDYKNYDMIDGNKNQRGFIAQQLQLIDSELIVENEGQLGFNSSGYTHTIGHAVQQLALREENTNRIAESNESKIHQLQQELSKANRRIEELESAV